MRDNRSNGCDTMSNSPRIAWTAIEEAESGMAEEFGADDVNIHSTGFSLEWEDDDTVLNNVHKTIDVLESLTGRYPEAELHSSIYDDGYSVSAWFSEEEDDE